METEFPTVEALVNSAELLYPTDRKLVENWRAPPPELQAMVPHIAELIVEGMGGQKAWDSMPVANRNIMNYTAVTLLAEARKRAQNG